ncbi:MAG: DNA polymerase III subunit delta, partial [Raoultibacter sp.]
MADVFESIFGQPQVRQFLRAAVAGDKVSHAYLFTGPCGSNKTAAAYAFAQTIVCR